MQENEDDRDVEIFDEIQFFQFFEIGDKPVLFARTLQPGFPGN